MKRTAPFLVAPILTALFCASVPGAAQNLISNPSFDTDLSGWKWIAPAEWSPLDANGSPNSGSALTHNSVPATSGTTTVQLRYCVPLADDVSDLQVSAEAFVPADQPREGSASAFMEWFETEDCTGPRLGYAGGLGFKHPHGSWGADIDTISVPEAAAALQIYLGNRVEDALEEDHLVYYDNVWVLPLEGGCVADDETLCLADGRFAVQAFWRTLQGTSGNAGTLQLSGDTGTFWFFDEGNTEVVVKVLDACDFANRFWVFAGGLTDVEVELRVTDTVAGETNVYRNPLGAPFQAIQDTLAFATCDE